MWFSEPCCDAAVIFLGEILRGRLNPSRDLLVGRMHRLQSGTNINDAGISIFLLQVILSYILR